VAFDGILDGGFTFGGAVGYSTSSVFTGRFGYFVAGSPSVGVWLRGGFTRFVGSAEAKVASGNALVDLKQTVGAYCLAFDPQLLPVAAPRFGITLGPVLDIPLQGKEDRTRDGITSSIDLQRCGVRRERWRSCHLLKPLRKLLTPVKTTTPA
jgi:hypothetical protein